MAIRLSCPSCNTSFTLPALPANQRATCPRCDDVFPIHNSETTEESTEATPQPASAPAVARFSLLKMGMLVSLGMALVGLAVALSVRPAPPGPNPEAEPTPNARTPSQLAGLGYLPADTNIVFAAQVKPVLAYAVQTHQDAGELLAKAGLPAKVLQALNGVGLTLQQIDHIAGGTSFADTAFAVRLTLVLVLHQPPADEDDFLKKLKAKKQANAKNRYDVELGGLPMTLAQVSPTIWVFGMDAKADMEAVERGGYGAGGKQFSASLSEMIAAQVPANASAWFATSDEAWAEKPGTKLVVGTLLKKPEWLFVLARGRAAVASLCFENPSRLRLVVRAADEATGQRLRDYFRAQATATEGAQHGGAGTLALFETGFDPATTFATLERFFADAGRK